MVDGLSANDDAAGLSGITYGVDAIEQFQVVTSGGQAELGRALGGYINVVTKSGTNALRGTVYDFFRTIASTRTNALSGTKLPMNQSQFGASLGGPIVQRRTFYLRQRRAPRTGPDRAGDDLRRPTSTPINARLAAVGYRGPQIATGIYPNPVRLDQRAGEGRSSVSGRDQLTVRYSLLRRRRRQLARRRRPDRADASSAPRQHRPDPRDRQHADPVPANRARDPRPVRARRPPGAADGSDRSRGEHRRRGIVRHPARAARPAALNKIYQLVNNLSHQAGAHAFRAGVDFLYNDDLITIHGRSVAATRSRRWRVSCPAPTTTRAFRQTFGVTEIAQTNPNVGFYVQDEWKVSSASHGQRRASATTCSSSRLSTPTPTTLAARSAWRGRRSSRVARSSAAAPDSFTIACRCGRWPTPCFRREHDRRHAHLRQIGVSLSPTQAGAPGSRISCRPSCRGDPAEPDDDGPATCRTDRRGKAASRSSSNLASAAPSASGYQYLRGRDLLMSVNQNVPTASRRAPTMAVARIRATPTTASTRPLAIRTITACTSRVAAAERGGTIGVSYTLSKSMNNVGEAFFSSPIDPSDLSKDWGRSDND